MWGGGWVTDSGGRGRVRAEVRYRVRAEVWAEVRYRVRAEVRYRVRPRVRSGVRAEVRPGAWADVRPEVRAGPRPEVRPDPRPRPRSGLNAQTHSAPPMIEKLRSRGAIDVPLAWKSRPGIISGILAVTAAFVVAATGGILAYAGYVSMKNAIMVVLGFGGLAVAFVALTIVATREDL